jgi:hypothetical protein
MDNPRDHRQALEDLWRGRLQAALRRYHTAKASALAARVQHAGGLTPVPDGDFALAQALRAETAALSEYKRILIIFNELVLSAKMPPDEPGNCDSSSSL